MKDKKQRDKSEVEVLLEYANSIIETLGDPLLVLDSKLNIISSNRAFYSAFHLKERDIIGRSLPDLGDGEWAFPLLLQLLKEIIPKQKVVRDYELEHVFRHIGQRVLRLNASQLRIPKRVAMIIATAEAGKGGGEEEDGEEELILLSIEDITARKRLQDELIASEERYRRAFETSRDPILLVHKIQAGVLDSNGSVQELLGYSHEELSKKKLWEIGITKDEYDFREALSILERDGVIHYEEVTLRTKEGQGVNTEVFLVDRAKVIQCNIRDVTDSKKLQEELKDRMQDLERFSKFAVGRELKMEELEKKDKKLEEMLKNK